MEDTATLQNIPLFSCLNAQELQVLREIVEVRRYPKDTVVLQEGENSSALYVVQHGTVRAVSSDSDGHEVEHNLLRSGDHFGEMSFIDDEPRSVTVVTSEESELLVIPREPFKEILSTHPDISFTLMKGLSRNLRKATRHIEDLIFVVAHQELHDAHLETLGRLVIAAEYKDEYTGGHIVRVSGYSGFLAQELGLPEQDAHDIRHAALMHDIGKIGIPEHILLKPGKLTDDEFTIMKTHPLIGAKILSNPQSSLLKCAQQVALSHHECFDGSGYPRGLSGEAIPLAARIVGLADTFDALVTRRPYQPAYSVERAVDILEQERGKHFDPVIVDAFLADREQIVPLKEALDEKSVSWELSERINGLWQT